MSDKQVRAQYTREFKLEAVRQVRAGQAIAVVAKVLSGREILVTQANWERGRVTADQPVSVESSSR